MSILLFLLAAAAQAPQSDVDVRETRAMVHSYGECVVKTQQKRASEAILANVDNGTLLRRYRRLIDPGCVPRRPGETVQMRFHGDQYRYALADALVRKELAGVPAPKLDSVPRLDHRDPGPPPTRISASGKTIKEADYQEAVAGYERAQAFTFLSRYGECVVRANPEATKALLLTVPSTPEESAQFAALGPALSACLPGDGETLKLGKLAIRGTLGVNYYRLAKAAEAVRIAGEQG